MKELIQGVKMQRNNTPNKETLETFDEVEEMQKHPENYKNIVQSMKCLMRSRKSGMKFLQKIF